MISDADFLAAFLAHVRSMLIDGVISPADLGLSEPTLNTPKAVAFKSLAEVVESVDALAKNERWRGEWETDKTGKHRTTYTTRSKTITPIEVRVQGMKAPAFYLRVAFLAHCSEYEAEQMDCSPGVHILAEKLIYVGDTAAVQFASWKLQPAIPQDAFEEMYWDRMM